MRQPRRRPQHVPRPRAEEARPRSTRTRWRPGPARRSTASPCAPCSRSARRSPPSPVVSGRPSRSPAPCCGTPSSSILDEPTAALGVAQTEQVLRLVRRLADRGLGVVLISHNLNDVFEVADDIAVLYLGQMVAQVDAHGRHLQPGGRADHHRPLRRPGLSAEAAAQVDEERTAPDDAPTTHRQRHRHDGAHRAAPATGAPVRRAKRSATSSATTSPRSAAATSARCPPSSA